MSRNVLKVACLQLAAGADPERNIRKADRLLLLAKQRHVDLACLPEVFVFRGTDKHAGETAETIPGPVTRHFQEKARRFRMYILLGSLLERSGRAGRFYNTSVLLAPNGRIVAVYRKRHLFDVRKGRIRSRESKTIVAGKRDVVASVSGVRVGLAICYDIRFPEFTGRLVRRGAEIIFFPSNFLHDTGKYHWEILCRSRAIENQCFVVAPNQGGSNPHTGRRSFGRSMIIDPWGNVLAKAHHSRDTVITAVLDLVSLRKLRFQFPTLRKRFSGFN